MSRDQKRLSLPFNLLSPKKGKPSPQRKPYISKPMGAIGPVGDSVGVYADETIVPLRVYCEIFGPSVHYKSVGVKLSTTAHEIISNLLLKMDAMGEQGSDSSPGEFCMGELCLLSDFSYFRLLDETTAPLPLFQRHSRRYGNSDNWRLKLILKSQITSIPTLFLADYKVTQDQDLTHIIVDCNSLDETYLLVALPIYPSICCENVINKIISEFEYQRHPDDFSLHCFSHPVLQNDPIPNATSMELLQRLCRQEIMELCVKYKYDDVVDGNTSTDNITDNISPDDKLIMSAEIENESMKVNTSTSSVEDRWVEFYDPVKDKVYYVNSETEEIRWLHPTTSQETFLDTDLPPGWVRGVDEESSRIFYRNTFDKKIEWSHPLRHLQRIYKHSLQPIGTTSLPRPTIPLSDRPPVPKSSRPVLKAPAFSQEGPNLSLLDKKSRSLQSSRQSLGDELERSSSDALLTDSLTGAIVSPSKYRASKKNKRLSNLRRFLGNERTTDISDNTSVGSGHKIKSLFTPLSRVKKARDPTWIPDVIVNLTPDHSPMCRKKSVVSVDSVDSITTTSKTVALQDANISNNSPITDGGLAVLKSSLEKEQSDTRGFSSMLSELAHSTPLSAPVTRTQATSEGTRDETAVSALDEAFSILDNPSSSIVSENVPALITGSQNTKNPSSETPKSSKESSEDLLNDCFGRISDTSFDEGSGGEEFESAQQCSDQIPVVLAADNKQDIEMEGTHGEKTEESVVVGDDDDQIGSSSSVSDLQVSAKVALFEQKLSGATNQEMNNTDKRPRNYNGNSNLPLPPPDHDQRDRAGSVVSTDSVSGESVRTEDSEGVGTGRSRNKLRTKKGRMSRNTSALDHQELEQLNKGVEPQKSILKHSRSDAEAREGRREKGVSFLTSSVQMIEIERMSNSDTSQSSEFELQSTIHRKGDSNWRNALKSFYDEVDRQDKPGMDELVWSPDEGIGLVQEERFAQEVNELTRNENLTGEVQDEDKETEGEIINSKHSLTVSSDQESQSQNLLPPDLPPRPTSQDIADLITSSSDPSPGPSTPKQKSLPDEITEQKSESDENVLSTTDSMLKDLTGIMRDMTSMVEDAGCVIHKNKVDATEQQLGSRAFYDSYVSQNDTGHGSAIADSGMFSLEASTNLEDSTTSPYKDMASPRLISDKLSKMESELAGKDEPMVVSSLVEPITPNAMVPIDVFRPKERSLGRENLAEPAKEDTTPTPLVEPVAVPVTPLHTQMRSSSPVLVDQLNKPLVDTAFVYGYQYHGKPTNKKETLHSGYLALVRQTMDNSEQQAKQQGKKNKH